MVTHPRGTFDYQESGHQQAVRHVIDFYGGVGTKARTTEGSGCTFGKDVNYLSAGGKSVHLPWATSAAMPLRGRCVGLAYAIRLFFWRTRIFNDTLVTLDF